MRQEIYEDPFAASDWDLSQSSRCFVHLVNSLVWRQITGENPPGTPFTAKEYERRGLPWFEYYSETKVLGGSSVLNKLKSVATLGKEKGDMPLPENESLKPSHIVSLRQGLKKDQVREADF